MALPAYSFADPVKADTQRKRVSCIPMLDPETQETARGTLRFTTAITITLTTLEAAQADIHPGTGCSSP